MAEGKKRNGELLIDNGRFALLYNVEGLKYTIGQSFESRTRQGEFLFCFGEGVAKTSHCQITSGSGGQFWVEDLQGSSGNGTFLNGERINGKGKVELKFGDMLTLGGSNERDMEMGEDSGAADSVVANLAAKCGCTTVFLFKALEEEGQGRSAEDETDKEMVDSGLQEEGIVMVEPTPFGIPLVLSKILGYLPLSDVKNCRLVRSEWKETATQIMRTNSVTNFNYETLHSNSNFMSATKSSRLFTFVQEMGGFFPQGRFHVKFPTCLTPNFLCKGCTRNMVNWADNSHVRVNLERKLLSDLEWFFAGGFPHPIGKLSLNGTFKHRTFRQHFVNVLKGCATNLEDLTLSMSINFESGCNHLEMEPFEVAFPSLKNLEFNMSIVGCDCSSFPVPGHDWSDEPYSKMGNWIASMITSAPNLKSLKLSNWALKSFGEIFLNRIITENGFPNLHSLELFRYDWYTLDSILKLPKMKSLKLGLLDLEVLSEEQRYSKHYDGEPLPTWGVLLGNVLDKSAETLTFLDLTLPRLLDHYQVRQNVSLPIFPNLKVFKLRGFYTSCFTFPNPGHGFGDHFPTLKYFDVCVNLNGHSNSEVAEDGFFNTLFPGIGNRDRYIGEEDYDDIGGDGDSSKVETGSSFLWDDPTTKKIPEEEHVVKSVKLLEIQNLEECQQEWSPFGVKRMNKLFPNAFNKRFETLRAVEGLSDRGRIGQN